MSHRLSTPVETIPQSHLVLWSCDIAFRWRWEWASLRKISIELLCVRFMGHVPNARLPRRGRVVKQYVDATAAGYFAVVAIPLDPFPDRGILSLKLCQLLKGAGVGYDRQSRSEEHTSELQSLMRISYAVFCLKKKKKRK